MEIHKLQLSTLIGKMQKKNMKISLSLYVPETNFDHKNINPLLFNLSMPPAKKLKTYCMPSFATCECNHENNFN